MFVKLEGTDEVVASDTTLWAGHSADTDIFFDVTLSLAGYGGRRVYLFVEDEKRGAWSKVMVDDFKFIAGLDGRVAPVAECPARRTQFVVSG